MIIGFANGNFYKSYQDSTEWLSYKCINHCGANGLTNAIELHCSDEKIIDYLLNINNFNLSSFKFISVHTPGLTYKNNKKSEIILSKLILLNKKYGISNFVFHTDELHDWEFLKKYNIPISIENMDNRKKLGKTINDIKFILNKYNFNLTLDLQHCYTNDKSMNLALNFQKIFNHKIIEYHLSGFDEKLIHVPLFKTRQNKIIESLKYKNIPIIIESVFSKISESKKELKYIKDKLN